MTFEEFYAGLEQTAREALDAHVSGLKTALDKERDSRKAADKAAKDAADQLKQLDTVNADKVRLQGELDAARSLTETVSGEVKRLQRTQLLRDVADTEGIKKPSVLTALDGQGKYEFELREVTEGEAKRKRAFIKNGEGDFVQFDQFVDQQWSDFKPALYPPTEVTKVTEPAPKGKEFIAQGTGGTPPPAKPATVDEIRTKIRQSGDYNAF